ncbi:DctP family TRAP transporter solute-binding subunit [Solibacillus sp. FSL H8-0538]|uniref:DctP family TRAP transporter solute-binding subunit n=1 Tax=Solibacillus sp. FSL H8-0538 TaxID=2921400 RepID=UPI0030F7CDF7
MKQLFGIIAFGFLLFIPLILVSCQSSTQYPVDYEQLSEDQRIVIRFSHVVGEDTPKGMAARKFAQLVKERSEGYIEVQVFSNGTLYKDGEEMNALQRGDIQLIAPATSKLTNLIPEFAIYDLPYAFRNYEEVHAYANGEVGLTLTEKLNEHNLISVGIWDSGFKQLSNSIRPISHYSDLRGLRMRIMPSDVIEQQFVTVGANPKRIDFNTVFNQLQEGNVDGQENTLSNITSKKLHSLQSYLTISNHGYLGYFLLFNLEFWNKLPKDVQTLLTDTLQDVQQWQWQFAEEMNEEKLQDIENCSCIDVNYLSEEDITEWEKAYIPVYDYYRKNYSDKYVNALPKFSN